MAEFIYRTFPVIGAKRKLVLVERDVQLSTVTGKSLGKSNFTPEEIVAFRCGIKWISGYAFTIGREYQIFLKDAYEVEMKISFKSIYGYNRKQLSKYYGQILDQIWKHHFSEMVDTYLNEIHSGETIELCGVEISNQSVRFKTTNFLQNGVETVPWDALGAKDYSTYYALFSKNHPADINRGFYYLDDWNAHVLRHVVEEMLQQQI